MLGCDGHVDGGAKGAKGAWSGGYTDGARQERIVVISPRLRMEHNLFLQPKTKRRNGACKRRDTRKVVGGKQ